MAEGGCGPQCEGGAVKMPLEMDGRDIKQDLIPNVGQLEFVSAPAEWSNLHV